MVIQWETMGLYFEPSKMIRFLTIVKNHIIKFDRKERVKAFKFTTAFLARVTPSGFYRTHPKGDNRTNASKRYSKADKKRKYATRTRISGVTQYITVNS
jgi:hypothetical protein